MPPINLHERECDGACEIALCDFATTMGWLAGWLAGGKRRAPPVGQQVGVSIEPEPALIIM